MSDYEKLLKDATPLPWKLSGNFIYKQGNGRTGANVATAGSPRAGGNTVGYEPLNVSDPDLHEAYRNAELINHSANVLPQALEALKQSETSLANACGVPMDDFPEQPAIALIEVRSAIAAIENVK